MIFSYLEATANVDGSMHWLPHNVDAFTIQQGGHAGSK